MYEVQKTHTKKIMYKKKKKQIFNDLKQICKINNSVVNHNSYAKAIPRWGKNQLTMYYIHNISAVF
jgi:tRNA(Glu) U13 pseudouridine synthase TruD